MRGVTQAQHGMILWIPLMYQIFFIPHMWSHHMLYNGLNFFPTNLLFKFNPKHAEKFFSSSLIKQTKLDSHQNMMIHFDTLQVGRYGRNNSLM
jgi:hypothetical protein